VAIREEGRAGRCGSSAKRPDKAGARHRGNRAIQGSQEML
jgi:hypothetical protein